MEQYEIRPEEGLGPLHECLEWYTPVRLFVRVVGSLGGTVKVDKSLRGGQLDFLVRGNDLALLIDGAEVCALSMLDSAPHKGFSLAYERITPTPDGIGRLVMLGTGVAPYDPSLPEPRRSFLRNVIDDHLVEVYFAGRVHLKFHSWWEEPYWKYWTIIPPPETAEAKTADSSLR